MRPLAPIELLDMWDRGMGQRPVDRALTLLATACPEMTPDDLARLTIGERDGRLLTLREWTFGAELPARARCPACGEEIEMTLNVADIRTQPQSGMLTEPLPLTDDGCEVRFRLPNSLDLAAVSDCGNAAAARSLLFDRCLQRNGSESSAAELSQVLLEEVAQRMADADPQADVRLALRCLSGGHEWEAAFDIASFFWSEINAWAIRILRDVHMLASAYGWTEADILALSPARRQAYLEMAGT